MTISATTSSSYRAFIKGSTLSAVQLELDFVFRTGDHQAFPYAHLLWLRFDASGTIGLMFAGHRIIIEGRNLGPLYTAILRHDVESVREADLRHSDIPEYETVVGNILVQAEEVDS